MSYKLKSSIINKPKKIEDHVKCCMNRDDEVALNFSSVPGSATGDFDMFDTAGAELQNTIFDGGFAGGDTVPFVMLPTSNVGVGIKVGPETFNETVGVADGTNVVELIGTAVDGDKVVGATGGLVGTLEPTIALQLGESKLAQMGVNDA